MIINRELEKAQISTEKPRYKATIAMNAETFSIMIDGIYQDKILAAVREPLFNAVDSHVEAGCKDKPIIIHSPTDLEPWYSVKDNGLGMDEAMVEQTFMVLGTSTKRDSNDLVGAKGIGSKAPFTVTDMFSVIAIKDGIKTVYSIHMDEGMPEAVPLHQSATTEGNGVEVKFNVDPDEIYSFRSAIVRCLRYAHFPYEINDPFINEEIQKNTFPVQYTYEEDGWKVEMFSGSCRSYDSVVVMGQQPYQSKFLMANAEWPMMVVTIPIGDCDVNPGREWTVEGKGDRGFEQRLKTFVEKAIAKRGKEIVDELSQLPTLIEVVNYMRKIGGYFATKFGAGFVYNKFSEITEGSVRINECSVYGGKGVKRKTERYYSYTDAMNLQPLVYNDDRNKLNRSRCNYLADKKSKPVFLTNDDCAELIADDPWFKGVGFHLSELEKYPSAARDRTYVPSVRLPGYKVFWYDIKGQLHSERFTKDDFSKIGTAMTYSGGERRGWSDLGYVNDLANQPETFLSDLGIKDKLYLVPLARQSWLKDNVRIIGRNDLFQVAKKNLLEYHLRSCLNSYDFRQMTDKLKTLGVKVKKFPEYTPRVHMNYHLSGVDGYHEAARKAERMVDSFVRMGEKYISRIHKRYPLMKHVPLKYFNSPEMVQYRKLIDMSKGENK